MKRLLAILLILLPAIAFAQHMKFMNIPLDGPIETFTSKLKQKGFTLYEYNNELPTGTRGFRGTFIGRESSVYVYYNPSTREVYRAKACIESTSENSVLHLFEEVKSMLSKKYEGIIDYGSQDGYDSWCIFVKNPSPKSDEDKAFLGGVGIYISVNEEVYPYSYVLHIDYIDSENDHENDDSKMDDL